MNNKSFLSEQTKKELGDFLTKYMQGEPHSILVSRVEEIESPVTVALREQFEWDNAQRKRQYYNELYRAAKRFIFSYEVYDLKVN